MEKLDRILKKLTTRRGAIGLISTGVVLVVGAAARRAPAQGMPACVLRPEQTEGPFFVEEGLNRSDIRSDPTTNAVKPGAPLRVAFRVTRVDGNACTPVAGAQVHVWHCDAAGAYSGVRDPHGSTIGQKFLRGYQVTDAKGVATFTTIYPGWYEGRAVHIHFKIRTAEQTKRGRDFTSQMYFDDAVTEAVVSRAPYTIRGRRFIRNDQDGLFRRSGKQLLIALKPDGDGYSGTFDVGLA